MVSAGLCGLIAAEAAPIASLLFGSTAYATPVTVAACVMFLQNCTVPGFAWLRAESQPVAYSLLSVANLVVSLVATYILVGWLDYGFVGSLLATGLGYALIVLCTFPVIMLRAGIRFRSDIAWNLLTFGVPQVFSFMSVWVLQLSDRYLLSRFGTLQEAASYSVAYSLGGVVSTVIIAPFQLAWPTAMYAIAKRKDSARVFQIVFRWFSLVLFFAAFGLSVVTTVLLNWLFPPNYRTSGALIPLISVSIAFYGIYILCMVGASVRRKTWMAPVYTTFAALLNVGINLVLIPRYGATGAATATLVAYVALAAVAYIGNQQIYPVPYEIGRLAVAVLGGAGLYYGSVLVAHSLKPAWTLPISLLGLALYGLWLAVLAWTGQLMRPRPRARGASAT
jgi:O-antigen/teichoic acid export membrane protein